MDSLFWGKDSEAFSVNVYTRTHTYIFRILVSVHWKPSAFHPLHRKPRNLLLFTGWGDNLYKLTVLFSLAAQLGIFKAR